MISESHDGGRFSLPSEAKTYRTIGPFSAKSLPKGLLREHQLKEGTWGRLRVLSGKIHFLWDDDGHAQDSSIVGPGAAVVIAPAVPHHLELLEGDVLLEIDFLEAVN